MKITVGINGFGRIGKLFFRHCFNCKEIDMIVVNDLMDIHTLAHLLKYDTVHGPFNGEVKVEDPHTLMVNGHRVFYYSEKHPSQIPWENHNPDYIIESSGMFTTRDALEAHLRPGIKKVLLSCPPTDAIDRNIVIGVNEQELQATDRIISNLSCTTNCMAPLLKILDEHYGIETAFMNTVHPYTNNQRIIDAPHKDLRRARTAAANIIPTTTTAIDAVISIMPHLKGKFDGIATRVPVPDGALIELTARFINEVSVESINNLIASKAANELLGILAYTEDPIVSSDIVNNPHSGIFDSLCTKVLGKHTAQMIIWYDNEFAYSKRLAELVLLMAKVDGLR